MDYIKKWLILRPWRRHSLVLTISGFVYIIYGVNVSTWSLYGPRAQGVQVALDFINNMEFWGFMWIAIGTIAVISSRWPNMSEKWGYSALIGWAAGWSATYFAGLFVSGNSVAEAGGGLVWALVAYLWWSVAGLVNPDNIIVVAVETEPEHGPE